MDMYRVRPGDSLWGIAQARLGAGTQWPRLWRYNNRADVIARTGRGIPDPDLIYPDQRLLLPILPGAPAAPRASVPTRPESGQAQQLHRAPTAPAQQPGRLSDQLPHVVAPIAFKYKLDDIKFPPIPYPGVILELKMTGDIVLVSRRTVPALYVTSRRELELQMTSQANHAFGALVSDNRLVYDEPGRKVTIRTMLVAQSSTPNVPATAIGVEMNSQSPMPKLRYEVRLPKVEGTMPDFLYVASGVVLVVEATPDPQPPQGPRTQPLRVPQPAPAPGWAKPAAIGLGVAATAVVVATLVEDFLSGGLGTADDPVSFAAAAAMAARARALWQAGSVLLPRAAIAATATVTVTVAPAQVTPGPQPARSPAR